MKIVIAEDHPMFRGGVRSLLAMTDDLEVIGEAPDGEEAVRLAGELRPDLILMDIRMPRMNGIEATELVKRLYPSIEVLIFTLNEDDQSVFTALKVGAKGYVLKDAEEEELLQAIRMVGNGSAVFGTGIAERMMYYFASQERNPNPVALAKRYRSDGHELLRDPTFAELTRREAEILALIAVGDTNAQIAEHLCISVKTVANNVSNILSKLHVMTRHEARKLVERSRLS